TREEMMAEVQEMRGEKIYEYDLNITGVTDYGVTMDAILSGKEKMPLQGTRSDVAFEGGGKGRLTGKVRGVDYLLMRADGRADLDVRRSEEHTSELQSHRDLHSFPTRRSSDLMWRSREVAKAASRAKYVASITF